MDRKDWDLCVDQTKWETPDVGAVRSAETENRWYGVSALHEEAPLWIRWLNWLLMSAEVPCVECDGRGDKSRIQCDHCEGQGTRLTKLGEKILHAHEFFERLQARIKYRRSIR